MIKAILRIISALLIILLLVLYVPYYFHKCDSCEAFFVGPGYEANIIMDALSEDAQVICKDCAETQHALSSVFGKDLDEYRRPFIENPVTLFNQMIESF